MKVAIISNFNGIGLQRDWELLRGFLGELGHEVFGYQYDIPLPDDIVDHDLAIFLEVVPRNMLKLAPVKFAFLNAEWVKPDLIKLVQRHIDKVFAKTHEAKRLFDPLFPGKVHYVGFMARDQYDPTIERQPLFCHIGGNSSHRGTQAVLDAWKWTKNGRKLNAEIVIVSSALKDREKIHGVRLVERESEDDLRYLQNACQFHLYPCGTEGYGHALHESLSVNATILTTDAPPMNELQSAYMIKPTGKSKYGLADVYEVSALDIYDAVNDLLAIGNIFKPREEFLKGNADFKAAFTAHLEDVTPQVPTRIAHKPGSALRVAFLGNFLPEDSTENLVRWALEEGLGHEVEILQENTVKLEELEDAMQWNDVFLWVRTPNFLKVPDNKMCELLVDARIPTLSLHLDKFWGIPEREALIGIHPFFKTKYVFTADGSRQDEFRARGVNHIYMKPAASEVFAHRGRPREHFRCDVGFVGARGYHSQHQFRGKLIDSLEQTYGDRFKLIDSVRGHELNDFYASCKIAVADCFGGGKIPHYWSDRMVETPMRYGFLLSPQIEGLTIPLATFRPEDLTHLHDRIEYWLTNEGIRKDVKDFCADHVAQYDTWSVRLKEILEVVL